MSNPKISLTRSPTAKAPELRLPAVMYDHVFALWASNFALQASQDKTPGSVNKVEVIVSLTAQEYFALGELAGEFGVTLEEALYCGYRILCASGGDNDVKEDCLEMLAARGN